MKRSTTVELVVVASVTRAQVNEDQFESEDGVKHQCECVTFVTKNHQQLKGSHNRVVTSGKLFIRLNLFFLSILLMMLLLLLIIILIIETLL